MSSNDVLNILLDEYNPENDTLKTILLTNKVNIWKLKEPHPLILYLTVKVDWLASQISKAAGGVDIKQLDLEIKYSQQSRLLLQLMADMGTLLGETKKELAGSTYLTGELSTNIPKEFAAFYTPFPFRV